MGKAKLFVDYNFNFDCYGIITQEKEYRVAWLINKKLGIHLVKDDDIKMQFLNQNYARISNFLFETQHSQLRLIKNKADDFSNFKYAYLMPEISDFDYLLIVKGNERDYTEEAVKDVLGSTLEFQFVKKFDPDGFKLKDNLIF